MTQLIPAIQELKNNLIAGYSIVGAQKFGPIIRQMDTEKLAVITLSSLFNYANNGWTLTRVFIALANNIRTERQLELMKESDAKYIKYFSKFVKNWNQRSVKLARQSIDITETEPWSQAHKVHIGAALTNLAVDNTDLFEFKKYYQFGKTVITLTLNPIIRAEIEAEHDKLALLKPIQQPMIVPPLDWTNLDNGGYLFIKQSFIKDTTGRQYAHRKNLEAADWSVPFQACNILQSTRYTICPYILRTIRQVWESGGGVAGLPSRNPRPIPERSDQCNFDIELQRQWSNAAREIHSHNAREFSQRIATYLSIEQAQLDYGNDLYFPHTADYRGRFYPTGTMLHPQGTDSAKGLLASAVPQYLNSDGEQALRIALCSSIGHDKVSYTERQEIIDGLYETIRKCVLSPMVHTEWMDWDKPFSGLGYA